MKLFIILFCAVVIAIGSTAQQHECSGFEKDMRLGDAYRLGVTRDQDFEKAFAIYQQCAENGLARAMNYLGVMYKEGMGCERDYPKAIAFFTKAGERGYGKAWFNLGVMYKFGTGVEMDYAAAYRFFQKSIEAGYSGGLYGAGYMLYRGHGVEQSYQQAVVLFKKGALEQRPSCMYYLGVCYRNGYGVEKDLDKAREWLIKSSECGYSLAQDELNAPLAENPTGVTSLKSARKEREAVTFKKLAAVPQQVILHGRWKGTKNTYDYSGKYLLSSEPVRVDFFQAGARIQGVWKEGDSLKIDLEGTITDNALHFAKGDYSLTTRYQRQRQWQFQQGIFQAKNIDGTVVLTGNLNEFTPDLLEPGKPVLVKLEREVAEAAKIEIVKVLPDIEIPPVALDVITPPTQEVDVENREALQSGASDSPKPSVHNSLMTCSSLPTFKVYPNPFADAFTLDYTLETDGQVKISLYDMHGRLQAVLVDAQKKAGTYRLSNGSELTPGNYLISIAVDGGKHSRSQIVIKTNN